MLYCYRINFSEGIDVDHIIDIITLHQKRFFSSPGISLKPRKDYLNIIFLPSNFSIKIDSFSHLRKVQNKNFSVISKHGIPSYKKYRLTSTFWVKKDCISHLQKFQNKNFSILSKQHGILC